LGLFILHLELDLECHRVGDLRHEPGSVALENDVIARSQLVRDLVQALGRLLARQVAFLLQLKFHWFSDRRVGGELLPVVGYDARVPSPRDAACLQGPPAIRWDREYAVVRLRFVYCAWGGG